MEYSLNNNLLTIILPTRIDSNSAASAEEELFAIIKSNPSNSIILDAKDLEYISSAGLRIVLKVKKTIDDTKIINVSNDGCL